MHLLVRVCLGAALALACTARSSTPAHAPIAPTIVESPPVVPESAGAGPTRWTAGDMGASCRADHLANLSFVPATATFVAGVDATAIVGSASWAELRELFERGDTKALVEIAHGCELGVSSWRGLTFGGQASGGSDSVMVLRADGIGRPDRLECMRVALERKQGASPWTPKADAPSELAITGGGIALALDPCTLVVVSDGWAAAVRDRVVGGGSSALDGVLGPTVAKVDARKPAWLATAVPAGLTAGSPFEGARELTGTMEVAGGLGLAMSVTFSDPAEATKRAGELQRQLDTMKSGMVGMGMPQPIIDSIRIVAAGAQVLLQLSASETDLRSFKQRFGPMLGP